MADLLRDMMKRRRAGQPVGVPSYCTANELVIEALLRQGLRFEEGILIEATANQVNQFGGYTGMRPADFRDRVEAIADRVGFPREKLVLGGDHLGPLTWAGEPEEIAMARAEELVRLFVSAGYGKIHLDTSMRLGDDPPDQPLSDRTIARRGARLYRACEAAYQERKEREPSARRPVYIIGSEVPIPGGAQDEENAVQVTSPEAAAATIRVYREEFAALGLEDAFANIIGIVVQPGVEFGDEEVCPYDREKAASLCAAIGAMNGIVMEGHSTDYQTPAALRQMCEDGVAILKVGPALTFALREGLFALSQVEEALIPEGKRADLPAVMEETMLADPGQWRKYYHGSEEVVALKRRYSYSDRCRYYLARPAMEQAVEKLLDNLSAVALPPGLLRQYLPVQVRKIREGRLPNRARDLLLDFVTEAAEDYNYATRPGYFPAGHYPDH